MKKNEIAKSSLLIQKEKELKELQKKKEKVTKNIKTTKTKIEELQTQAEAATMDMAKGFERMVDLSRLSKEVGALLKDLRKKVKLTKRDKDELNEVLSNGILSEISENVDGMFEDTPFGSAEGFANRKFDEDEHTDEFNRQRRQTMFEEYLVKPTDEEQQAIRKVYVGLAGRFHPDKAENETELALFNDLMQSINSAYKRGDMDELLEIKARFAEYKTSDAGTSDYDIPILDVLDEQILRQRNELNVLESQILRLKAELKNLRDSDLGKMVKQNKEAEKYGESTTTTFSDGTQFLFEVLEEMKKIMNQWIETGKKPMAFNQFVDGSHPILLKGQESGLMPTLDDFDDEFDEDSRMSEEEMMEIMAFLSMMEGGGAPKRRRSRR
jgi:hypothetical protein